MMIMAYGMQRVRRNVCAAAMLLLLVGCALQPFDATAPWAPNEGSQGRSYTGGQRASVPESPFDRFEGNAVPAESVEIPDADEGNPWAERPENVTVRVCYGRVWSDREAVDAAARELCPQNARVRYLGSDTVFNDCPLLQPSRAVYRCLRPESAEAESDEADGPG